eukprot:TRINITY_DN2816_c0_g1_i2.p1 TRINITY_DN2816_c0_g1~~TRINITY_DN2816_c0_g1_i2.p1  ORF type:complete len:443 (+),score=-5.02 TRINITY_DN2816_c0_g1_i2:35-1330(+)
MSFFAEDELSVRSIPSFHNCQHRLLLQQIHKLIQQQYQKVLIRTQASTIYTLLSPQQQLQTMSDSDSSSTNTSPRSSPCSPPNALIADVWDYNFLTELKCISALLEDYPVISFDTEFPGVVDSSGKHPVVNPYFSYPVIKSSVEKTNLIQFGITLTDLQGNLPDGTCTWQFHLKFDLEKEYHSPYSIDLLKYSGIDFDCHKAKGISPHKFAEHLITSGLVMSEHVQWVCFHGGFDCAYLLKLLSGDKTLPSDEYQFKEMLRLYVPRVFDVKSMAAPWLDAGLSKMAKSLGVERIGTQHQAGSDSFMTAEVFCKVKNMYRCSEDLRRMENNIYGMDAKYPEDYYEINGKKGKKKRKHRSGVNREYSPVINPIGIYYYSQINQYQCLDCILPFTHYYTRCILYMSILLITSLKQGLYIYCGSTLKLPFGQQVA